MYRLQRIDSARMPGIHLHSISGFQFATAFFDLLKNDAVVFDEQSADRNSHPAVLVAMIMDGTGLTHFPTDCNQFVEQRLVDQIAVVVLAIPVEVRSQ